MAKKKRRKRRKKIDWKLGKKLADQGMAADKIAERLGCQYGTVQRRLFRNRSKRRVIVTTMRWPADWVERMRERSGAGNVSEFIRTVVYRKINDDPKRPLSPPPKPGRPRSDQADPLKGFDVELTTLQRVWIRKIQEEFGGETKFEPQEIHGHRCDVQVFAYNAARAHKSGRMLTGTIFRSGQVELSLEKTEGSVTIKTEEDFDRHCP